ncbi:MAG: HipA N-terminal domain-containing protein [Lewinella sp.]
MIDNLIVSLDFGTDSRDVGTLVRDERSIYFRYNEAFLLEGYSVSPFKLPFIQGIQTPAVPFFDGLFGVFSDSLPDGWGRLVIDRAMRLTLRRLRLLSGKSTRVPKHLCWIEITSTQNSMSPPTDPPEPPGSGNGFW